ncbi:uncharacterized protein I303_101538 [Kwoniella dejecticola CBS 10117]|uniref:Zinc finger FYVE domain-containing protein 19 n=1 Tax=Kwoniella dejecticola CBS 10117 TaxID=1296121 RepID=A0A1A6ADG3_9TREE|nr:uncharacterized protein I303_02330 [Kwoniella dejecticola CBS 10117]OBR88111.1 hypothetical protein I303_02330 [Kwoniella dejecticola CBS 10117]
MSDEDLFARFAALRAPSHHLEDECSATSSHRDNVETVARQAKAEDDELGRIAEGRFDGISLGQDDENEGEDQDEELRKRMANLRGSDAIHSYLGGAEPQGDADVEELLASFENAPSHDPQFGDMEGLDKEAKNALKDAKTLIPTSDEKEEVDADHEQEEEDEETEEQILTRALEEASLERLHDPPSIRQDSDVDEKGRSASQGDTRRLDELGGLSFPSLPTHVLQETDNDDPAEDVDEDTKKRLNALLGLSPSPHKPGQAPTKDIPKVAPKSWNLPGFDLNRDEDTETWCCICNKDATLICLGCDDDLYCEECWREGHGLGDGQERGHRTKRFVYKRQPVGAA